jgi:hypothetical protein
MCRRGSSHGVLAGYGSVGVQYGEQQELIGVLAASKVGTNGQLDSGTEAAAAGIDLSWPDDRGRPPALR